MQPSFLSVSRRHATHRSDFLLWFVEPWIGYGSQPDADAMARARRDCIGYISVDCQYARLSLVLEQEGSPIRYRFIDIKRTGRHQIGGHEMIPRPAQYLLRFDDLCPTMSRSGWDRFPPLFEEYGIRPILAVVPDNKDCELIRSPHDTEFWCRMRSLESTGATIALHGYQHRCESRGKSILGLHRRTEFAGIAEDVQRQWIRSGLEILRRHELNPMLWVAPRHGFDAATLSALHTEGIDVISDGLARTVGTRGGVRCIPQQLWSP